jgi:uncharacterized protein (TIGR00255 family)
MQSMTGFASVDGVVETDAGPFGWRWDARSVNHRGLDLKLRLPPGFETEEQRWRRAGADRFARGSVSVSLSLNEPAVAGAPKLDAAALDAAVDAARIATEAAKAQGLDVAPPSADGLLRLPGVFSQRAGEAEIVRPEPLLEAVRAGFSALLERLAAARADEGAALETILLGQVEALEALRAEAETRAAARSAEAPARLEARIAELLAARADRGVDPDRLAQEIALLAVKADVREELDRLSSHLASARALIADSAPIGRRFDFLTQELLREANTLCAKSQDAALTETGLAMKVTIDQLKEQTANVE